MSESSPFISVEQLFVTYDRKHFALENIEWKIKPREFWGILGPNGSGKTTLLKTMLGLIPVANVAKVATKLTLFGKEAEKLPEQERAKLLAYVPQLSIPVEGFSVQETVELGLLPHLKPLEKIGGRHQGILIDAMQQTQVMHLRNRHLTELSGGEYQRVLIARAMVQQTPVILLDEPTSHLDFGAQHQILYLLQDLLRQSSLYFPVQAIVATFHDIPLAGTFCTHLLLLREGKIIAAGPRDTILTEENIFKTYGIPVTLHRDGPRLLGLSLKI